MTDPAVRVITCEFSNKEIHLSMIFVKKLSSLLTAFTLALSAFCCAPKPKQVRYTQLFPDGKYSQSVRLFLYPNTPQEMYIPFSSRSEILAMNFKIIGLTPFGTKAFFANGNLKEQDKIQLQFFMEKPKGVSNEFIKDALFKMQNFKSLSPKELQRDSEKAWIETRGTRLEVYSFNTNGIPLEFKVSCANWKAYISTSRFIPTPTP